MSLLRSLRNVIRGACLTPVESDPVVNNPEKAEITAMIDNTEELIAVSHKSIDSLERSSRKYSTSDFRPQQPETVTSLIISIQELKRKVREMEPKVVAIDDITLNLANISLRMAYLEQSLTSSTHTVKSSF